MTERPEERVAPYRTAYVAELRARITALENELTALRERNEDKDKAVLILTHQRDDLESTCKRMEEALRLIGNPYGSFVREALTQEGHYERTDQGGYTFIDNDLTEQTDIANRASRVKELEVALVKAAIPLEALLAVEAQTGRLLSRNMNEGIQDALDTIHDALKGRSE